MTKSVEEPSRQAVAVHGPEPVRNHISREEREGAVTAREDMATRREGAAAVREEAVDLREETSTLREEREGVVKAREGTATRREGAAAVREDAAGLREEASKLREETATLREGAAGVREEAAQARQDLRDSRDLLTQTGRLAKVGGWQLDGDTQTLHWTEEIYRIHEVDLATKPTIAEGIQFYAPEARPVISAAIQAAIDAGTPFNLELPLMTARGRHIWVHVLGEAERRDGKTIRLYGAFQDITERKRAEEELSNREDMLQRIFDLLPVGLWLADKDGKLLRGNPAGVKIWGAEPRVGLSEYGVFKGRRLPSGQEVAPDDWALAHSIRDRVTIVDELLEIDTFDGKKRTILNYSAPVFDAKGEIQGAIVVNQDITERKRAEEERATLETRYRQAQKMESVGQLASGIAHDFNNLLTVINGMSELLLAQVNQDDPMHADVQEILRAGERAAALTRQLLAFSRQQILELRVMSLNTVVARMESLLRRLLSADIDLVVVLTPGVSSVNVDPGQIEQVITNLAVNARDAMPRGGQLTIETENVTIDAASARQLGEDMPPGSYVRLAVSDSGVGMDEATRGRIYEPFFTTKGPGKGTGLGLSTVYGIVKQSRGFIGVYSEVGQGTTFNIYLPQVTQVTDTAQLEPTAVSSSGTETILLAEDNAGLRKLATRVLEPAGYTVLGAASGEEALLVLERQQGPVDLLLSDVVMSGMSGRHLAERLAQTHPGTKVLYMSGYTSDTIVRHGVLEAQVPYLNKPFTAAALLRKIREVLDS